MIIHFHLVNWINSIVAANRSYNITNSTHIALPITQDFTIYYKPHETSDNEPENSLKQIETRLKLSRWNIHSRRSLLVTIIIFWNIDIVGLSILNIYRLLCKDKNNLKHLPRLETDVIKCKAGSTHLPGNNKEGVDESVHLCFHIWISGILPPKVLTNLVFSLTKNILVTFWNYKYLSTILLFTYNMIADARQATWLEKKKHVTGYNFRW